MSTQAHGADLRPVPGALRGNRLAGHVWMLRNWPLQAIIGKASHKLRQAVGDGWRRIADLVRCSHTRLPTQISQGRITSRLAQSRPQLGSGRIETFRVLADQWMRHRFDLLGSGWVEVTYGMSCRGLEGHGYPPGTQVQPDPQGQWLRGRVNPANLEASRAAWAQVATDYCPIDWQLDFKSGFRWGESIWHKDIRFGHAPGADVKLPWELARMQHLAALAQVYALASAGHPGFEAPDAYAAEFRNQILDFIANNPPRFGVNWVCTMDVAIRAANWLLAWDLFVAGGAEFDRDFELVLMRSLYAHGLFICNHLEWQPELRSNHYLANIAGLLFIAAYLPAGAQTDRWLTFGSTELVAETSVQFLADGGNFEASTSYHRLGAEMVLYATALVAGLAQSRRGILAPFPGSHWERIERMAEFVMDTARPDGRSPQFGDNDSGRFFKVVPNHDLQPVGDLVRRHANLSDYQAPAGLTLYPLEDHLDHRHVVAAANAFFQRGDFADFASGWEIETQAVGALSGWSRAAPALQSARQHNATPTTPWPLAPVGAVPTSVFSAATGSNLTAGLSRHDYPDFGLYVYKSPALYLAVRCGPVGLKGLGAHAHNDPLSIELWIDGHPVIVDPGCYLYTALPGRRNAFRSVAAHFSPHFEGAEPASLDNGLFALGDEASPECLVLGPARFAGRYRAGSHTIWRSIEIGPQQILVTDWSDAKDRSLATLSARQGPVSQGYGWITAGPSP